MLRRLPVETDTYYAVQLSFPDSLSMPASTRIGKLGKVGIGGILRDCALKECSQRRCRFWRMAARFGLIEDEQCQRSAEDMRQ